MKILAVEFSSEQRSIALLQDAKLLGQAVENGGRCAIGLVEQVLQQAGCEREEVEVVAVGLGPGSYAGIRAAIALAQGWQLGLNVKLLGISSVECLAAGAEKFSGPVNIVIDAQRNEFYLARYEIGPGGHREIEPLRLAPQGEIAQRIAANEKIAGPDLASWFPGAINLHPEAAVLGKLAVGHSDFVSGEKLEPIYLRETAFKKAPPLRNLS
jgi:tRNA threonylcarbamoyladenosine biosynthesis protein TsaB